MSGIRKLSRRDFLHLSGTGAAALVLGVELPGCSPFLEEPLTELSPNVFVTLDSRGRVTIVSNRAEMGQGIRTGLPMVVADEMEADWERVTIVPSDGTPRYGPQATDGSQSVRIYFTTMRQLGASCRQMLEQAAAERWGVPRSECRADLHRVRHLPSGRIAAYGDLVEAASRLPVPSLETVTLKEPAAFRYIGRDLPIHNLGEITAGRAIYGADGAVPGMVVAAIARSPVLGGAVESWDDGGAREVPGVLDVLHLEGAPSPGGFGNLEGVAVIAENTWAAIEGRNRLMVEWREGANAAFESLPFAEQLDDLDRTPVRVARDLGDTERAFASAARTVTGHYRVPYLTHAAMEPLVATAHLAADGSLELWAPAQYADMVRGVAAEAAGIEVERVTSHQTLLGSSFGRKGQMDYVTEAVKLAQRVGRPVRVQWTRDDDIRHGYYHALSVQRLEAALDGAGRVTGWRHRVASNDIGSTFEPGARFLDDTFLNQGITDLPFAIPNVRVDNVATVSQVRIGWYRSVYNINSAFAIGSFVDELALARGMDPIDSYLELLGPDRALDYAGVVVEGDRIWNYDEPLEAFPFETGRLRRVVEAVRERSGWDRPLPPGRGRGFAAHRSFLTYVACVVEVEVDGEGRVTVPRVDYAVDCGIVVNPDRVRAQFEGGAIFALSHTLHDQVTFSRGRASQSNFHDYPVVRMSGAPGEIAVHLVGGDDRPTGAGEPPVPPLAPALCNAIVRATGIRVRDLPVADQLRTDRSDDRGPRTSEKGDTP